MLIVQPQVCDIITMHSTVIIHMEREHIDTFQKTVLQTQITTSVASSLQWRPLKNSLTFCKSDIGKCSFFKEFHVDLEKGSGCTTSAIKSSRSKLEMTSQSKSPRNPRDCVKPGNSDALVGLVGLVWLATQRSAKKPAAPLTLLLDFLVAEIQPI